MPKKPSSFVLGDELDELEYDFSKFIPGAKGTIPEPSSDMVRAFHRTVRRLTAPAVELMEEAKKLDQNETDITAELLDRIGNEADEQAQALMEGLCDAAGELCSDSPNAETIRRLPWRGQKAFIGWLSGTFLNPES